jgi:hypothetical protein
MSYRLCSTLDENLRFLINISSKVIPASIKSAGNNVFISATGGVVLIGVGVEVGIAVAVGIEVGLDAGPGDGMGVGYP